MGLFQRRKPNVKSLAKAGKVDGLVEASQYREILVGGDGVQLDAGAPIREEAVLALGDASEDGDRELIVGRLTEALEDPVDRVQCAAVMTLYRLDEPARSRGRWVAFPAEPGRRARWQSVHSSLSAGRAAAQRWLRLSSIATTRLRSARPTRLVAGAHRARKALLTHRKR